uniref:40S ribosomal protein S27 n=1 Tax=Pygocentrus nattereri TaxID=42514 RepID=A0A3B4DA46_PYGNA
MCVHARSGESPAGEVSKAEDTWRPFSLWLGCNIRLTPAEAFCKKRDRKTCLVPQYLRSELAKDLLHPTPEEEKRRHKKKRLVQSPNSYFMDVKCPGCYKITTVFSHAQTVVLCVGCSTVLCQPTGGKARLTEGCSFRRKQH